MDFNIAIPYTKKFKLDDVYLAILAYKLSIKPTHDKRIQIRKSVIPLDLSKVLTAHHFGDVREMKRAWITHQLLNAAKEYNSTELPFKEFTYPLNINMVDLVRRIKMNGSTIVKPINVYNHSFHSNLEGKCKNNSSIFLVIVVKSAASNFERRFVIRETWGNEHILQTNNIKTLFLLSDPYIPSMQSYIDIERDKYNDVIQIDAQDTYSNNSLLTTSAIKWVAKFCNETRYVLLVDDDFYIATDLLVNYLSKLDGKSLYMGRVWYDKPQRGPSDTWMITIKEYPFDRYPPFISTGVTIMSIDVVIDFSIAIPYIKNFKLDTIYLAIVAYKLRIKPQNHPDIYISQKANYLHPSFRKVLASHGFDDVYELKSAWEKRIKDYFIDNINV